MSGRYLKAEIHGNVGQNCATYIKDSSLLISGKSKLELALYAQRTTITITEITNGSGWNAKRCTFKLPFNLHPSFYDNIPRGNRIILINPDGTEIMKRDYQ